MESALASSITMSPETAAALSGVYRLLARLWLYEVDHDLLNELRAQPLRDSLCDAGVILPEGGDDRLLEELEIDYCRLFLGPADHLPPFQSVWQSGQFQSATTVSMNSLVEIAGYDTGRLPSGMMLDHLGVQLDVMGHIFEQAATWGPAAGSVKTVFELADFFFARHLSWPGDLLDAAARRASTDFYRSTIKLTSGILK